MSGSQLWTSGPAAIAASGNSGPINVSGLPPPGTLGTPNALAHFWLSLVTGTPSGTTPTLVLHVDGIDPFGNVLPDLAALPAGFSLTTVAGLAQASFGVSETGLITCAPAAIQVRWVVGGTTPNYPAVQMSLYGR